MSKSNAILVAYDFSDTSELALKQALSLALSNTAASFHVLVALDRNRGLGLRPNETVNAEYAAEVQKLATQRINHGLLELDRGGAASMMVHVRIGDPAHEILVLAEEVGANLVIIGSHGRTGINRMMMGSVSEKVVREAQCPVLVARSRGYAPVSNPEVVEVESHNEEYIPPHRYHYDTGVPTRKSAWVLY